MKPTRSINHTGNPNWRYVPKAQTDVAATFRRVRREMEAKAKERDTVVAKRRVGK